jgi:protein-L-isoaspartate(D-aspartate) O-methyltransferase
MTWFRRRRGRLSPEQTDALARRARERMVREQIEARGIHDPDLLRAMRAVPRHLFVDHPHAYEDRALPLPNGQTISQPYVVAAMTAAARPDRTHGWKDARVLEVGTGSGYQAAVLAELGAAVTSIERHAALSADAARRLEEAGYDDVRLLVGDGSRGDAEGAPWDVVIVTAAGPSVPQPLLEQLDVEGGRLVMPVGTREHQVITLVERRGSELVSRRLEPVAFVPLLGDYGFRASDAHDEAGEADEADEADEAGEAGE